MIGAGAVHLDPGLGVTDAPQEEGGELALQGVALRKTSNNHSIFISIQNVCQENEYHYILTRIAHEDNLAREEDTNLFS